MAGTVTAVALRVVCHGHPRVTLVWRGISTTPDDYGIPLIGFGPGNYEITYNPAPGSDDKIQGRCTGPGCRTHVQWRIGKVDEVLRNLAGPGVKRTWTVTPVEMDVMTRRPDVAASYLAKR